MTPGTGTSESGTTTPTHSTATPTPTVTDSAIPTDTATETPTATPEPLNENPWEKEYDGYSPYIEETRVGAHSWENIEDVDDPLGQRTPDDVREILYTSTAGRNEHAVKFWNDALENVRVYHGRTDPGADEDEYPDEKVVIEIVNEQQVRDKFDPSLFPDELPGDAIPIAVQDPNEQQQPNATLYIDAYRPELIVEYASGTTLGRALKIPYDSGGGVMNYKYQVYPRWAQDILNDWGSVKTRIDDAFLDTRFARWHLVCGNFDAALENVENARSELDGIGDDIESFIDRVQDRDVQYAPGQLRETITVLEEDYPPVLNYIEQQANNENAEYVTDDAPYMGGIQRKVQDDFRPTISLETAMFQTWLGNKMPLGKFSQDITPEQVGYADYGGCGDGPPVTTPPSTG